MGCGGARARCKGRCQGFHCHANVAATLALATGQTIAGVIGYDSAEF